MALVPQMPTFQMRNGLEVCRIINGMWQVSGAHGKIDPMKAQLEIATYVQKGFTSFDMADIYGPAEEIFGNYMKSTGGGSKEQVQGLTKLVQIPPEVSKESVRMKIVRSMSRMWVRRLDCVQLHWWDYQDKRYIECLRMLSQLQSEGMIREVSVTNFDTKRLMEAEMAGTKISTNQVQFSLVDMRPLSRMKAFCMENNIKLLCYGTLCGGLLTDKYLGKREPRGPNLQTASLVKYKKMIDLWGGWELFQQLLVTLRRIGDRYSVSVANVATRAILDDPCVGGVIVGCRLGRSEHIEDNYRSVSKSWSLDERDWTEINQVLKMSNNLMEIVGDCGSEYRAPGTY